jgi:ABC-type glycerol-3-phosphate transport system substrate-binding protein
MPLTRRTFLKGALLSAGAAAASKVFSPIATIRAQNNPTVNLLFPLFGPTDIYLARIQEELQTLSGVQINPVLVPINELDRAIRSIPQQPERPDVICCNAPNVPTYAYSDIIQPVTNQFTQGDLDDFFPGVKASTLINGEFYGPGTNESSQALYYDRAITEKYGITPPSELEDAWSWQEAIEVFRIIQDGERRDRNTEQYWAFYPGQGGMAGGDIPTLFYHLACIYRGNGERGSNTFRALSEDGLTTTGYINTPEAVEGLQFIQDMFQTAAIAPLSDTGDFFYNEQVAFWWATPFQYGSILEINPALGERLGVTPLPYLTAPVVQTGAFTWCLVNDAPNTDAGTEFVRFMGSQDGNRIYAGLISSIPIRRSLVADFPVFEGALKPFVDTVAEWAQPRPLTPGYSDYELISGQMLVNVMTGSNPKTAADDAAAEIDRQLRRYAR